MSHVEPAKPSGGRDQPSAPSDVPPRQWQAAALQASGVQPRHDRSGTQLTTTTNEMNKMFAVATVLASLAAATSANAQSADAGAGAKIIAPLEISNVTDRYFGTIAPSTTVADTVTVLADGSRKCGPALTCLTADHTAAAFADDKLRYSPRQLVLEPGARQVVRIMASAPGALAPGEYRSHLRLMSAPVSAGSTQIASEANADNSLSIELVAIRSITIPVILRVGALDPSVTMDKAAMAAAAPDQLAVRLTRLGTHPCPAAPSGRYAGWPCCCAEPDWQSQHLPRFGRRTARCLSGYSAAIPPPECLMPRRAAS